MRMPACSLEGTACSLHRLPDRDTRRTGDPGEAGCRRGRGGSILLAPWSPPPHSLKQDLLCEGG